MDGVLCLAAAYLEEEGEGYRYRYAVLCGGEAAKRVLKTADLDPGDSDEPGSRRVALATYEDYVAFVDRLRLGQEVISRPHPDDDCIDHPDGSRSRGRPLEAARTAS